MCDVCRPTPGVSGPEQPIYARIAGALPITFEGDSTALRSLDGRQRCERLLTALMKLPKIGGWGRIEKLTECTVYDGSGGANAGDVEALQLELKLNMPHHLVAAAIGMPRAFHLPRQKVVRTVGADGLKEDQAPDPPVAKDFSAAEPPPSLKLQRALIVADKDYTFGKPVDNPDGVPRADDLGTSSTSTRRMTKLKQPNSSRRCSTKSRRAAPSARATTRSTLRASRALTFRDEQAVRRRAFY